MGRHAARAPGVRRGPARRGGADTCGLLAGPASRRLERIAALAPADSARRARRGHRVIDAAGAGRAHLRPVELPGLPAVRSTSLPLADAHPRAGTDPASAARLTAVRLSAAGARFVSLFAELKRRKVVRVAVVYAATAFAVLEAADLLLPRLGVPDWVMNLVVALIVLGFPIALVLAWALELTPEGIKRTGAVTETEATPGAGTGATPALLGKRTVFASALLVVLGLGIGAGWFLRPVGAPEAIPAAESAAAPAATAAAVADKTIAVLPFADFSPARDHEWFADGLTEEILNALARTPDLLVTARTSSFRYKDSTLDIPQIAAELGVAHVLEGSIRSTPQRIRVTAQLIRAADGFHLWSQTYDRDPADMIEIQEDLARNIALAMETTMDPQALSDMARVGTRSVEAYQAYIRGIAA